MQTSIHSVPRRRTIARSAHTFLRVPLFNLFEAGRGFLASTFYPRLRSLRSLSLGLLRIKPRRGFALVAKITLAKPLSAQRFRKDCSCLWLRVAFASFAALRERIIHVAIGWPPLSAVYSLCISPAVGRMGINPIPYWMNAATC